MGQIRFQIGTPRTGSAARSAEESHSPAEDGGWTRAKKVALSGSAARAAEEAKRAEGIGPKQSNTIGLRASGGAVVDRETMMQHSALPGRTAAVEGSSIISSHKIAAVPADFPEGERISNSRIVSAEAVPSLTTSGEQDGGSRDTTVQPGLLQSAAARIQSLTRSLFQRRDTNG